MLLGDKTMGEEIVQMGHCDSETKKSASFYFHKVD